VQDARVCAARGAARRRDGDHRRARHFTITVEGRGARRLSFDLPPLDAPVGWVGDTNPRIRFAGKKKYALGNLRVVKDCGPLESC
jgi:hypothetical protein